MAKKITKNTEELNEAETKILKSFFPKGTDITLKDIMGKSGYTYEPVYRNIQELLKREIISEKKFGKTLVYSLDFKNTFTKIAYYLYATERANKFSSKEQDVYIGISELPSDEMELYTIFGSYSKGTNNKNSDVDILCVTENINKIKTSIESIKRRYNLKIHPVIIPKIEFAKIKNENPELWNDLVDYSIIFKGYELFYYYAYENKK